MPAISLRTPPARLAPGWGWPFTLAKGLDFHNYGRGKHCRQQFVDDRGKERFTPATSRRGIHSGRHDPQWIISSMIAAQSGNMHARTATPKALAYLRPNKAQVMPANVDGGELVDGPFLPIKVQFGCAVGLRPTHFGASCARGCSQKVTTVTRGGPMTVAVSPKTRPAEPAMLCPLPFQSAPGPGTLSPLGRTPAHHAHFLPAPQALGLRPRDPRLG